MKKLPLITGVLFSAAALHLPAAAQAPSDLEQRLRILERKLELADEAAAKAKDGASVKASAKEGFQIASHDGTFKLKLGGYMQADARFYSGDEAQAASDTFLLRRVHPQFDGTLGEWIGFRIMPDHAGSSTTLQDAYIDLKFAPEISLRAGKFKQPFGLERLQSGASLRFVERGLPTSLGPNRDLGVQLGGNIGGGVEYQVGVFNGVADGATGGSDRDDGKDAVARLFLTPFKDSGVALLEGLSLGVAGSYGDVEGSPTTPTNGSAGANSGLAGFRTAGQQSFFSYSANATNAAATAYADGDRVRVSPQATWYLGSLGLLAEYVESSQEVRKDTQSATLDHSAWQVALSYLLTGEANSFRGVTPAKPFAPGQGGWGALELVARYGELDVDDAAFQGFADAKRSATHASAWAAGLNWYLTRNLKFQATYEQTSFDGGAASGDRADEKVAFTRLQVAF
jgi:phosphate-selective porin OprO/OprP